MRVIIFILLVLNFSSVMCQRNHLTFEATFENSNLLEGWDSVSTCGNTISSSDTVKRFGNKSIRFQLNALDTVHCSNIRSQLIKKGGPKKYESWYGFSVYFSGGYPNGYDGVESFFQFYRDTTSDLPPLTLNYEGFYNGSGVYPPGKYITLIQQLVSPDSVRQNSEYTEYHYPIDTVEFNKWIDIVLNVKWSNDSTGFIRMWVNNKLVYIYSGINNYTANYMRAGLDKIDWRKNWKISSTSFRVLHLDEVRIGDSMARYIDVLPGGTGVSLPIRESPVAPTRTDPTPFWVVNPIRSGILQFQIPSGRKQKMSYELIDMMGRVLTRGALSIISGENYFECNVKHLAAGMYFLAIQSESGLSIKKTIKL